FPMPSVLISAFRAGRQRLRATLLLGVIYAAGWFLVLWLSQQFFPLPAAGAVPTPEGQGQIAAFYLGVTLLHAPLTVLFWHAPALVHWHGVSPLKSLFFSAVACFRNLGAFLVYGLAWLVIISAGGIAFGLVGQLLGGPAMVQAVLMPTLLLLAAMFSTSIYFTFRDSFIPETPASGDPDPVG
ncbi:MAG: BPSS1780 family membrane protein, partial [Ramlibacter sp.]